MMCFPAGRESGREVGGASAQSAGKRRHGRLDCGPLPCPRTRCPADLISQIAKAAPSRPGGRFPLNAFENSGQGLAQLLQILFDHHVGQFFIARLRLPTQRALRLSRIAQKHVHFRRAIEPRIGAHPLFRIEIRQAEDRVEKLLDRMRLRPWQSRNRGGYPPASS